MNNRREALTAGLKLIENNHEKRKVTVCKKILKRCSTTEKGLKNVGRMRLGSPGKVRLQGKRG